MSRVDWSREAQEVAASLDSHSSRPAAVPEGLDEEASLNWQRQRLLHFWHSCGGQFSRYVKTLSRDELVSGGHAYR